MGRKREKYIKFSLSLDVKRFYWGSYIGSMFLLYIDVNMDKCPPCIYIHIYHLRIIGNTNYTG